MRNALRQSAARVTDSFDRRLHRTRLTLTLVYVTILAFILASSGGITRWLFSHYLEGRFQGLEAAVVVGVNRPLPPHMMEYLRNDLLDATLLVNGVLLLLAGLLSYWLAGFTLRPIQAAYNRQRQFLGDVSHELRTPLTILQTNLENELRNPGHSVSPAQLRSHLEEVERMGRLVCDSLVLSRLDGQENGHRPMRTTDMRMIVQKTVERMRPLAEREGIDLRYDSSADEPLPVLTYGGELLARVVENLVSNAIKYNRPDGLVEVTVERRLRQAVLRVLDTGQGIAEDEQERVFRRFYRAEKSRTRQAGGSGLGLSIVQSVVETLKGEIDLESQVGQGTEVTVSLPVHRPS